MAFQIKRQIGQILLDGGFLSDRDLSRAFNEQKRTRELLGQVLVKMGMLKAQDINAPLSIQEHLSSVEDAVKIAAGERQLLGALLVQSGRITGEQLDHVIAEQKRTGEKLGDVFTRLGMLTERQCSALLEFQSNQSDLTIISPLRLGELMIATGYISRDQLNDALEKQSHSHKKIGEVLIEEGYVKQSQIRKGFRLQKMLVKSVLASILSLGLSAPVMASSVSLQWDASTDADVAGYKVYHSAGSSALEGTTPLNVANQTSASLDGLDPNLSYEFAVTAYNAAGAESSFSNIVTLPEQAPPTIDITSPADSASVSGTVSIAVNATDNVGVTKVEFYINGALKATDTTGPYVYTWDTKSVAPGAYTLMVKAYDAAGNVSQSSRTVTVVSDTIAPTVAMTAPANSTTIRGLATVSAGASDNVGVTRVEFYSNGVLIYSSNVSPYSFNWDTTKVGNGVYVINAMAFDNAGNSSQSSSVTVLVDNVVSDTTLPIVNSFSFPSTSTTLTVPVSGFSASDNVGVTGYLISESSNAPSAGSAGWSASAPTSFTFSSAGNKTAYSWAKDAAGNVSASRSASVTITLLDTIAPVITDFKMATSSATTTVSVSSFTATDNIGVAGYLITESATKPAATATGWKSSVPSSFTFSSGSGTKTAYAWVKDAAGNVSAAKSVSVKIRK
ncbi:MAG: Ig-like domain-containing protein [Desulfuromonadaceae bacterium]